jgi:hypothetical protein
VCIHLQYTRFRSRCNVNCHSVHFPRLLHGSYRTPPERRLTMMSPDTTADDFCAACAPRRTFDSKMCVKNFARFQRNLALMPGSLTHRSRMYVICHRPGKGRDRVGRINLDCILMGCSRKMASGIQLYRKELVGFIRIATAVELLSASCICILPLVLTLIII